MRRIAAGLHEDVRPKIHADAPIHRLIYVSFATERDPLSLRHEALEIAIRAAKRNAVEGLTGALAVSGGWFAQVIEGPVRPLMACFDRILCDARHTDMRVLNFEPIEKRHFSSWSMAYSGEISVDIMRQAVIDYAAQEQLARDSALQSARTLLAAMACNLPSLPATR